MKERPILFSAPMVRALLAGVKTQTRRVIKQQPSMVDERPKYAPNTWGFYGGQYPDHGIVVRCPYGTHGDRLWVRETWQPIWASDKRPSSSTGWNIGYVATDGVQEYRDDEHGLTSRCKPAIFMPRWASRITLEVTGVRVERVQDISASDAVAEGVIDDAHGWDGNPIYPRARYRSLWQEINGAESWDANPWVWVVEFAMTPRPSLLEMG